MCDVPVSGIPNITTTNTSTHSYPIHHTIPSAPSANTQQGDSTSRRDQDPTSNGRQQFPLLPRPLHHFLVHNPTSLTPIQALCNVLVPGPVLPSPLSLTNRWTPPDALPPPLNTLQQAQSAWRALFRPASASNIDPIQLNPARPITMTLLNQRNNTPWGDILIGKESHVTRVYAMNVNGLQLDRMGGKFDVECKIQKEVQADILCGQEHNLDTSQSQVRSILYDTARQHWPKSRMVFGTTPITFANMYKPGGTHIVSVGNITGRIIHQESDRWGRWVSQTFRGQANQAITVISAYQVVGKPTCTGCITAASQQQSLLMQSQDTLSNPREAFRRDLMLYLRQCIHNGHDILLMGDFNEPFGGDPDGMEKIAAEIHLIDLMSIRHSTPPPATYARGRTRLDYALSTAHVAAALIRAGYESFNERFHTDHRAYHLDFDTVKLFGTQTQQLGVHAPRFLRTGNIAQVTEYIKLKYDTLMEHNVFERAKQLALPGNRHEYAERLDKDILAASLAAESKLQRIGEPAWSISLQRARQLVSILNKCLTMIRTGIDHTSQIEKYKIDSEDITFVAPRTRADCNTRLRLAKKEVHQIVQTSFERRDKERNKKIQALEDSIATGAKDQATRLRRIRKAEATKKLFQTIKHFRNPDTRQGITRIEIPAIQGDDPRTSVEWKQIEVPTEVLYHLQERNRHHFGQAHGTPFTVPPLGDQLGYSGQGPISDSILEGTYDTAHLDPQVALLITHLQQTAAMAAIDVCPTITETEYVEKLAVWKESTSTSPSGLHLGHYKVLLGKHRYSDVYNDTGEETEESRRQTEWNHMQTSMLQLHVSMLNYALQRGYSYKRWQTVINTILFKDPDNVRIHRTRVIHIYEADYNLTLGVKWRAALYQAEKLKELNPGQYGSRPYRNAVDPVLIEELQFEISRASRKMLVQTNYDAMSCYDRIIPCLAMLVSRKFGVPRETTQTNATTLQQAKYRIRTELGVAETFYEHSEDSPIYGTGQGSGNSPMIWCFLSCILFDCYDLQAHKAKYCSPDRTDPMDIGMIGFVDDSNGQTNDFQMDESSATLPTLVHNLQANAQLWANLLGASGGALELSKCSSHLAAWQFTPSGEPVLTSVSQHITESISVVDPNTSDEHDLTFLSPYTAHKTLGHYKEPAGTQITQFRKLKAKSDSSTEFLWTCRLNREEAWTYYYACYLPSIGYPLSCSSLTYPQLDRVQRRAMQILVAKCGYNRNTKREILYGPLSYGGANLRHLYVQQGVGQVTAFLKHWRGGSVAGQLLRCALAWTQMTAGTSYSILINVTSALPHLESKWLTSLRIFLATIHATIEVDKPGIPCVQREHDRHLMDMILESNLFTKSQIRRLNYCRLYLQASTLSDITQSNGLSLDRSKLHGHPSLYSSTTSWLKVHQDRPTDPSWKLWQRANKLWSAADGSLIQPLGRWTVSSATQRQRHFAYCYGRRLAIRNGSEYHIHRRHSSGKYRSLNIRLPFSELPSSMHPIDPPVASRIGDTWTIPALARRTIYQIPAQAPISATFEEFLSTTLEAWELDLLRHTELLQDPYTICELPVQGICAVSDGSVRYHTDGSYGWSLSRSNGLRVATGMGPVRSRRPQSYRAEARGMLAFMRFLIRLAEYTGKLEPWTGTLGTDSQSVLDTLAGTKNNETHDTPNLFSAPVRISGTRVQLDTLCPDWDVLVEIQHALDLLPELKLQYVQGHQDRIHLVAQLPIMAQLNVEADGLASIYQDVHGAARPYVMLTPLAGAHLHFEAGTITHKYAMSLRHEYSGGPLLKYIQHRNRWTNATAESVNWESHGAALQKHISHSTHYTKLVHDLLPTLSVLNRQDKGHRKCPCCNDSHETRDHILRCPASARNRWRHSFLSSLETHCIEHSTDPHLQQVLLETLRAWLYSADDDNFAPDPRAYPPSMRRLVSRQTALGWRQIFNGRFAIEWSQIQDSYLYRTKADRIGTNTAKMTGIKWQTKLILHIWIDWYALWKIRNDSLHGKDLAAQAVAETKEVTRRLTAIYDLREHMEPSAQRLLCEDIQQHLLRPTWVTKNWLNVHAPLFQASIRRVKTKAIQGVRSIRTYFAPPPD